MKNKSTSKNPTLDFYGHLDAAFVFFNDRLFEGSLPKIMFELTNKKQVAGLFKAASWQATDGVFVHSIAINPQIIVQSTPLVIYITLVKEMVHLWQNTYGEASRPGYHNSEWAEKIESIGLMPSSTGLPNGKKVGQKMSCYLIAGGAFESAAVDFFLQGNFINLVDATIDDADVLKLRNQLLLDCVQKNQSLTEYYEGWQSIAIEHDAARQPSEVLRIDVDEHDYAEPSLPPATKPPKKQDAVEDIEPPAAAKPQEAKPQEKKPDESLQISPSSEKPTDAISEIKLDAELKPEALDSDDSNSTSMTTSATLDIDDDTSSGYTDFDIDDHVVEEGGAIFSGEYNPEDELDELDDGEFLGESSEGTPPIDRFKATDSTETEKQAFEQVLSHLVVEPLQAVADVIGVPEDKPKYDYSKTKYTCSNCNSNVWGKPSMNILCVDCDVVFDVAN